MAGRIPQHFIDDLLSRIDIVDVVSSRIELKRAGNNHKACCPFHGEKTPSFTVSQNKQFYHCFGCGVNGSAIGFLMEYDGLHFVDAIETLAEMLGVEVPREQSGSKFNNPQAATDNRELFQLMETVAVHYVNQLKNSQHAVEYLTKRGLSGSTAKRFRIGYAPDGYDNLDKTFSAQRKALETTGMLAKNDRGNVYARFRDRIMFPIRDRRGRVIGFGGRVLEKQEPKYLNSPETLLFHKSKELYGLYESRRDAQDSGYALIVEGYMDVVALAEAGIGNAMATLGTSPNQHHCETLFRIVPRIVFCFDGDRAGREAAWRAAQAALPCLRDGRDAHFLFLPDGEDPDSLVANEGRQGFEKRLNETRVAIIDYLFEHVGRDIDTSELGGKARLAEQMTPLLMQMPEGIYRNICLQRLENIVGFPIDPAQMTSGSSKRTNAETLPTMRGNRSGAGMGTSNHRQENRRDREPQKLSIMRHTILLLLNHPELASHCSSEEFTISEHLQGAQLLVAMLETCKQHTYRNSAQVLEYFRDTQHEAVLQKLMLIDLMPDGSELEEAQAQEQFRHCLQQIHNKSIAGSVTQLPSSQRTGLLSVTRKKPVV